MAAIFPSDRSNVTCEAMTGLLESCYLKPPEPEVILAVFCGCDMVLSDRTIKEELARGRIVISPLNPEDIQPASVDLHLDGRVLVLSLIHI